MLHIFMIWFILFLYLLKLCINPIYSLINTLSNKNNFESNGSTLNNIKEIYNIDQMPNVSSTKKYINLFSNNKCSSNGLYLGPDDIPLDCTILCKSFDYTYKFLENNSLIVHNVFTSRKGGYCLPNKAANCNTYTSKLIKTVDNWKCIPKGKLFGGEDGCQIIGCNGFVKDNLTGIYYRGRIPLTLALSDPETETVPYELVYGSLGPLLYRFQCTDTEIDINTGLHTTQAKNAMVKDFMNNKFIESEYSRFDRIRNSCASLIYNASNLIVPNFKVGTCTCLAQFHSQNYDSNIQQYIDDVPIVNLRNRCSPCVTGWFKKEKYLNVGIPCRKSFDNTQIDVNKIILPCGLKKFDDTTSACLNVKIFVSKGLSHFARKIINKND